MKQRLNEYSTFIEFEATQHIDLNYSSKFDCIQSFHDGNKQNKLHTFWSSGAKRNNINEMISRFFRGWFLKVATHQSGFPHTDGLFRNFLKVKTQGSSTLFIVLFTWLLTRRLFFCLFYSLWILCTITVRRCSAESRWFPSRGQCCLWLCVILSPTEDPSSPGTRDFF